jgi:alpha-L-fucosidase
MGKPSIRWVGNELGLAKESHWNVVQEGAALEPIDDEKSNLGMKIVECDGLGNLWMPAECDTPIHHYHWFWHPKDDSSLKSLKELMHIYHHSVGRGANLLLNIAPNPEGLLDLVDVERAKKLGDRIRKLYSSPISQTNGTGNLVELGINPPVKLRAVIIQEDISKGQRIREYILEYQSENSDIWHSLYHGTSIGYKRIEQITSKEDIKKIRLRVLYSFGEPLISNLAVY